MPADSLKRQLGFGLLTAYGVGIMVGAGIYVLVGVGYLTSIAPVSFETAMTLPVAALAEITTLALLIVFAIVNASLIGLKRRAATATFSVPVIVPWFGLFACLAAFAASIGAGL